MTTYNSVGDGATVSGPVVQAGDISTGVALARTGGPLPPLDHGKVTELLRLNEGAPVGLTRGEALALLEVTKWGAIVAESAEEREELRELGELLEDRTS